MYDTATDVFTPSGATAAPAEKVSTVAEPDRPMIEVEDGFRPKELPHQITRVVMNKSPAIGRGSVMVLDQVRSSHQRCCQVSAIILCAARVQALPEQLATEIFEFTQSQKVRVPAHRCTV
jgi:hypothetical protein